MKDRNQRTGNDKKLLLNPLLFILAIAWILIYTFISIRLQRADANAIHLAGQQRILIERYLDDVLFISQGRNTTYSESKSALESGLYSLLRGGMVSETPGG